MFLNPLGIDPSLRINELLNGQVIYYFLSFRGSKIAHHSNVFSLCSDRTSVSITAETF